VVAVDELREAPCRASVLFPRSGGNIHTLTAVTPCALLDVLAPPYAEDLGRPSTYFSDMPVPSLPGTYIYSKCFYMGMLLLSPFQIISYSKNFGESNHLREI